MVGKLTIAMCVILGILFTAMLTLMIVIMVAAAEVNAALPSNVYQLETRK